MSGSLKNDTTNYNYRKKNLEYVAYFGLTTEMPTTTNDMYDI